MKSKLFVHSTIRKVKYLFSKNCKIGKDKIFEQYNIKVFLYENKSNIFYFYHFYFYFLFKYFWKSLFFNWTLLDFTLRNEIKKTVKCIFTWILAVSILLNFRAHLRLWLQLHGLRSSKNDLLWGLVQASYMEQKKCPLGHGTFDGYRLYRFLRMPSPGPHCCCFATRTRSVNETGITQAVSCKLGLYYRMIKSNSIINSVNYISGAS